MSTRMRHTGLTPFILPAFRGAWDVQPVGGADYGHISGGTYEDLSGLAADVSETSTSNTLDALFFVLVTNKLEAQTIDGTLQINTLIGAEIASDVVYHVHAWVTQGDTGNLRGTLLADHIEADSRFVPDTNSWFWSFDIPVTLSSVVCSAGDRLVLEIGLRFRNTVATEKTINASIAGQSGVATDAPEDTEFTGGTAVVNWFEFSDDIAEIPQAIRATQVGAQVIQQPTPVGRATQIGAQVIQQPTPAVRLTQIGAQVIRPIRPGGSFGTIIG